MRKEREELRRGIRAFIQDASVELAELTSPAPDPGGEPAAREGASRAPDRPLLRLVQPPAAPPAPEAAPGPGPMTLHPRRGVCAAYLVNPRCWEIPDAFCNQALHVCRLRECPIYGLHQEELERRFAAKFKHLW
ncbi:MAG: hypothetical protein QN173_08135 [Armatimonadota bacterium]|nr:hypothetical protein [Armatimonadota bacterium]MDR7400772.1 hypothetical protein [Armatimonadota bacterium]MDR7403891.1 hypothetical protein [Armatimonadota bacterium]MDR7436634.1 hypothetical protein [Armatimonadota bacterium]MDR7472947.1 hypothetical protein [Armatimonadota bacterium]